MDQQIWQWTLTKEAVTPCFVRDVLAMREHVNGSVDFFWLGHIPCRTVLLVGMVVGIQVYDKRAIYTIDDGTAVIDCILRHPRLTPPEPKPRSPARHNGGAKSDLRCPSPKKQRLDNAKLESTEPPPPITEPGYPVRVVGRVVRHYQSKQIHADTIDPCPSSVDEIVHLERVIELHKTKYSTTSPFIPPPKPSGARALDTSMGANTAYTLPPPPMPVAAQNRNRPPPVSAHTPSAYHNHTRVPSSPTASSIASSTPSSPCKPTSPVKVHEGPHKPKLRHPSRLHTGDLTGNTFRLYLKHYMDNAPSPIFLSSSSRSTCGMLKTPTKHARDEEERTPRPRTQNKADGDETDDGPLGFTLSHLRRVPELALLAARVVRAEARKREKANRAKQQGSSQSRTPSTSLVSALARTNGRNEARGVSTDSPRKKIKRLFSWAVVKLYEEGAIVLWDGDVRPLPAPPAPIFEGVGCNTSGPWKEDMLSTFRDPSVAYSRSSISGDSFLSTFPSASASVLYTSSASASLYSHYHPPRRPTKRRSEGNNDQRGVGVGAEEETDEIDVDADPGNVSDPDPDVDVDEEAYVPLTPRLLAGYVREVMGALRHGRGRGGRSGRTGTELTPENILKRLQQKDSRWARVGVWAVEEALTVLKGE